MRWNIVYLGIILGVRVGFVECQGGRGIYCMVVQYYVFCQNIILVKDKMSWNNEDLDCYHARIYDSAKDKPTCGNGSFCV